MEHLRYVGALPEAYNANVLLAKGSNKSSRADIRCTRPEMALRVVFVWTEILSLRRFCGRANSSVVVNPERVVPGQVWMIDNFGEQQLLL